MLLFTIVIVPAVAGARTLRRNIREEVIYIFL